MARAHAAAVKPQPAGLGPRQTHQTPQALQLPGAPMQQIYEQISRVAGTSVAVFITGESGAGRQVVAQTVHDLSRRRERPFLAVNCGAIPSHLIESDLFGHEKGGHTGARRRHIGFFERAAGGTLFLDEITETPLELQVKLLRALETGRFMRMGSSASHEADVRIVAATTRPPAEAVTAGKLREDLLYRLNVFPIELPSLREGLSDTGPLARLADAGSAHSVTLPIGTTMARAERLLMLATLRHFQHQKERTAAALGISLKTLYNRLKAYAAQDERAPAPPRSN